MKGDDDDDDWGYNLVVQCLSTVYCTLHTAHCTLYKVETDEFSHL